MRKLRGFTLIELLIVVAIIAILAAIAVPNFLEAQVRSKVVRAKGDMRTIAIAIESYAVDLNQYPTSRKGRTSLHGSLNGTKAWNRITFASMDAAGPGPWPLGLRFLTLTTPQAYITTVPDDPFSSVAGCKFGYVNAVDIGWIMYSYGPDGDKAGDAQIGVVLGPSYTDATDVWKQGEWQACSIYNPYRSNPTIELVTGIGSTFAFIYDPTNGSVSPGDVASVMGSGIVDQ